MNAIVMMDLSYCIGINGDQVVHIPDDLKRFKELTTGKTIVYGRKTLETFPDKQPLPDRNNIIISKTLTKFDTLKYQVNTQIVNDINEIIKLPKYIPTDDIFIIGGESIYKSLFPWINRIYVTRVSFDLDHMYQLTGHKFEDIKTRAYFPRFTETELVVFGEDQGQYHSSLRNPNAEFLLVDHDAKVVQCKEFDDKFTLMHADYLRI